MSDKDIDRRTRKIPVVTNLVLKESLIRLLNILREVGVEHERWYLRVGQLRAVLYLDILTLD